MNVARESAASEASEATITEIQKYCTTCWRNARVPAHEWADLTQQVFERLLERVPTDRWKEVFDESTGADSPRKEFLRGIDTVKKRCQRTRKFGALNPNHLDGRKPAVDADDVEAVQSAAELLPEKQRQIIFLILGGHRNPDVVAMTGRTPDRVSDDKYKAIRRLRLLLMQVQA